MLRIAALSLGLCLCVPAWADTDCPRNFAAGQPPTITNPKLQPRTREACFETFAVLHSGLSRTPLYSAEHLTRPNLEEAKMLSRRDSYHAESTLPVRDRAELSDYAHSGYDRGHMSPNADMPTRSAQAQSFTLANMVPQVHVNNAGVWAGIEAAVRQLAMEEGDLYVVTGPAFIGNAISRVGNVLVPTHLWKMIYSPAQQRAGVYLITNDETHAYTAMSVSQLQQLVGVNALPGVSQKIRDGGMDLPPAGKSARKKKRHRSDAVIARSDARTTEDSDGFTLRTVSRSILDILKRVGQP
ncbi:MAG: DNA/RNA non-specific endonuclease [Burkholderiaceae bacterium]